MIRDDGLTIDKQGLGRNWCEIVNAVLEVHMTVSACKALAITDDKELGPNNVRYRNKEEEDQMYDNSEEHELSDDCQMEQEAATYKECQQVVSHAQDSDQSVWCMPVDLAPWMKSAGVSHDEIGEQLGDLMACLEETGQRMKLQEGLLTTHLEHVRWLFEDWYSSE